VFVQVVIFRGDRQEETMAKGNNSRKKETKKPKKDAKKK
jgi:hypothetical protein